MISELILSSLILTGGVRAKPSEQLLQMAFKTYVEAWAAEFEKRVAEGIEIAKSRGTYRSDTIEQLKRFFQVIDYQKAIDEMVCFEADPNTLSECSKSRRQSTVEMWNLQGHYPDELDKPEFRRCEIKARLLLLETRYRPFGHLREGRGEFEMPRAYDAATYVDCVKSKL